MKPTRSAVRQHIKPDDVVIHVGHFCRYLEKRCAKLITIDPRPGIAGGGYIMQFGSVTPVPGVPQINLDYMIETYQPTVIIRGSKIERL